MNLVRPPKNIFQHVPGNLDIAYILGIYLTDGYVVYNESSGQYKLELLCLDKSIHERFQLANKNLFGKYGSISPKKIKYFSSLICSKSLVEWLVETTNHKKVLPQFVYDENLDWKKEFLAGLLDGDGYFSISKSRYETLNGKGESWYTQIGIVGCMYDCYLTGVPKLLDSMGIKYGIHKKPPRQEHYRWQQHVIIRPTSFYENNLYFYCDRKQKKVENYRNLHTPIKFNDYAPTRKCVDFRMR